MMYSVSAGVEEVVAGTFGEQLRECRIEAGLSMGQLAKLIHYSKGYLSKIENDVKPPTPTVARLCDGVLEVGGKLLEAALYSSPPAAAAGIRSRPVPDELVIDGMRTSFEQLRRLGLLTRPALLLEPLKALQHTVHGLARENTGAAGTTLLRLAARIAEYTGWMSQEAGDEPEALRWTRQASELSRAAGDPDIASYTFVREAGLALYRRDARSTITLAQQAQWIGQAGFRVLALAARREAQGHALAGDRYAAERAFARAAQPIGPAEQEGPYPVLGSSAPDPLELARGWSLCDLGLTAEAAAVLDRQLTLLPASSRRSRARFGTRLSLAYALSGEVDQSCTTFAGIMDDAAHVDSATIRTDLQQLTRALGRWHNHGAVREISADLKRLLAYR